MNTLNLRHENTPTMPVELDEIGLVHVLTPTKGLFDELMRIIPKSQILIEGDENLDAEAAATAIDEMYKVCAHMLSRNKELKTITPEDVGRLLLISDIIVFFQAYTEFIGEAAKVNEKN